MIVLVSLIQECRKQKMFGQASSDARIARQLGGSGGMDLFLRPCDSIAKGISLFPRFFAPYNHIHSIE